MELMRSVPVLQDYMQCNDLYPGHKVTQHKYLYQVIFIMCIVIIADLHMISKRKISVSCFN